MEDCGSRRLTTGQTVVRNLVRCLFVFLEVFQLFHGCRLAVHESSLYSVTRCEECFSLQLEFLCGHLGFQTFVLHLTTTDDVTGDVFGEQRRNDVRVFVDSQAWRKQPALFQNVLEVLGEGGLVLSPVSILPTVQAE
ncbi:hypothetical protein D3C87_1338800 [compost metagenome]